MQQEIVKQFMAQVKAHKQTHPNIASLHKFYSEDGSKTPDSLSFDEMRLIEELLVQGDSGLKSAIESNIELFLRVLKVNASVKGCRWDDIVFKFEYQAIEPPKLLEFIRSQNIPGAHKDFLISRLNKSVGQELDIAGLESVVGELEIIEKDWEVKCEESIKSVLSECHERIKHA